MVKFVNKLLDHFGYEMIIRRNDSLNEYKEFLELYNECAAYTMTSIERMYALYNSVAYISKNGIPGDFIECGVWRGGSSMLIAKALKKFNCTDRHLYLFDTFEGMNKPTDNDKDRRGHSAEALLKKTSNKKYTSSVWCYAELEEVEQNMKNTGYPFTQITLIKGKVEDTLPKFSLINKLSLLRLDTDWYESTKIEMNYLYPHLERGGVLILDDYGHWQGARKAIDEYIVENNIRILLNRIDYTGRIAIKL